MIGFRVFGVDAEQLHTPAARALEERFPGVRVWYGLATRKWWALEGGRLLEADTPEDLAGQIAWIRRLA
ncbi:hypothetical protein [Actinomadura miaoliensis]|uniref:Uncharacterized protein n=1 Tax=Actinomadura miaoliensis TaxID=430685 RepID=A0ABP7WH34_9ACTN